MTEVVNGKTLRRSCVDFLVLQKNFVGFASRKPKGVLIIKETAKAAADGLGQ